jgi:methylated-DNA-[protein]-cysteine S-methyltransferase
VSGCFALFPTPIGACAIVWGEAGLLGVFLPGSDETSTRRGVLRRFGHAAEAAPDAEVNAAIASIGALLAGRADDLRSVRLDMRRIPDFQRRVYEHARGIGPGQTRTYGEVAAALGDVGLARAVGQALGANPFAIVVPCHRVLAAGGRAGGFSAPGGIDTKRRLLEIEGARIGNEPSLF